MDTAGISKKDAKKLKDYLDENPDLKKGVGNTIVASQGHLFKDACELHIDDINLAMGKVFKSGQEAYDAMGSPVTLGFNDYGTNSVGIDLRALEKVAQGINPGESRLGGYEYRTASRAR